MTVVTIALLASIVCPAGYVPGWLDDAGVPTSCVRDCPYATAKECRDETVPDVEPVIEPDVEPETSGDPEDGYELAETGAPDWMLPTGIGLALAGAGMLLMRRREAA